MLSTKVKEIESQKDEFLTIIDDSNYKNTKEILKISVFLFGYAFFSNAVIICIFVPLNVLFDYGGAYIVERWGSNDAAAGLVLAIGTFWITDKVFEVLTAIVAGKVLFDIALILNAYIKINPKNIKSLIAKIVGEVLGICCILIVLMVLFLFFTIVQLDISGLIDKFTSLIGMLIIFLAGYVVSIWVGIDILYSINKYVVCRRCNYFFVFPIVFIVDIYIGEFLHEWFLWGGFAPRVWDLFASYWDLYEKFVMTAGKDWLHLAEFEKNYRGKGIEYTIKSLIGW